MRSGAPTSRRDKVAVWNLMAEGTCVLTWGWWSDIFQKEIIMKIRMKGLLSLHYMISERWALLAAKVESVLWSRESHSKVKLKYVFQAARGSSRQEASCQWSSWKLLRQIQVMTSMTSICEWRDDGKHSFSSSLVSSKGKVAKEYEECREEFFTLTALMTRNEVHFLKDGLQKVYFVLSGAFFQEHFLITLKILWMESREAFSSAFS